MDEMPWLRSAVDQKIALMQEALQGASLADYSLVMTTLTEPPEGASADVIEKWERTCDFCERYCPPDEPFYTGSTTRQVNDAQVIIMFGVCQEHRE